MTHGEKTTIFLKELCELFVKHNLSIAYDTAREKFLLLDLNGAIPADFADRFIDESINKVEAVPSKDNTPVGVASTEDGVAVHADDEIMPTVDEDEFVLKEHGEILVVDAMDEVEEETLTDEK